MRRLPERAEIAGKECIKLISNVSPGRVEDHIDSNYFLVKISLLKQDLENARAFAERIALNSEEARNMQERATQTQLIAKANILGAKGKIDEAQNIWAEASRRLALLERTSGMIIDATSDAFLFRSGTLLSDEPTMSLDRINSVRSAYGARLIDH